MPNWFPVSDNDEAAPAFPAGATVIIITVPRTKMGETPIMAITNPVSRNINPFITGTKVINSWKSLQKAQTLIIFKVLISDAHCLTRCYQLKRT
jgi:hypothetical protein